ncbi:Lysophospholipase, alpha-beta hydrolase superfamily [Lentibacillus halodurans]|uniref:Lysophospholipase, alpha-beta hydrolase superfamily n=1 Tax=Lentibacillus halodurans TaxID=237679 RepID=A0A1I0Z9Q1_9BACI|nr:alpha/beta hydrolase [Lentibacillus halodurans]SFB22132.1 Lysophospholipase, alpha-beta hydrolase superfamily [Lentibacillus halodurans]
MNSIVFSSHFKASDGVRLFYRGWIPENPRALLILVHGAGEHSGRYANIGEACMEHQIALIAPDLRGFGQSEGARGHVNHFKDYIDDLKNLIELLHCQYQFIPLFLFGHSLGGLIVIRYGQIHSHKANGFVLSSPALGFRIRVPLLLEKLMELISRLSPNFSVQPSKWAGMLKKIRQLESYFPEPVLEMEDDPFYTFEYTPRWFTELLHNGIHALSDASRFSFPLLCFYDQEDPIVHPGSVQRFLDTVSVQDKKYILFAEGQHRPWNAPHCDQALNDVFTWLNTRL